MSFVSMCRPLRIGPLGVPRYSLTQPCSKRPISSRFYSSFASNISRSSSTAKGARPLLITTFGATLGVAGVGLGLSVFPQALFCDPASPKKVHDLPPHVDAAASKDPYPPPPKSAVNVYELTFGTVCGICAGVFVKKGAKFVAFTLGGIFVLLQYLGSLSLVRVNWSKAGSRFENLFYTTDASGARRPPSVYSLWKWLVDFLTADFQPRASFLAGLALGVRIG